MVFQIIISSNFCKMTKGKFFESEAIAILDISFHKNWTLAEQLLLRQLPHWGNNNCIELAITSRSFDFIAHQSVQRLLKSIWRGSPNPTQSMEMNHYLSLVCPVAAPALLSSPFPSTLFSPPSPPCPSALPVPPLLFCSYLPESLYS